MFSHALHYGTTLYFPAWCLKYLGIVTAQDIEAESVRLEGLADRQLVCIRSSCSLNGRHALEGELACRALPFDAHSDSAYGHEAEERRGRVLSAGELAGYQVGTWKQSGDHLPLPTLLAFRERPEELRELIDEAAATAIRWAPELTGICDAVGEGWWLSLLPNPPRVPEPISWEISVDIERHRLTEVVAVTAVSRTEAMRLATAQAKRHYGEDAVVTAKRSYRR